MVGLTMAEYIDREEYCEKYCRCSNEYCDKESCPIWKAPAADVAPVVHGRWDNIPNTYMLVASKDGSYSGNATTCSVCHEVNPNAYKTNYCPNCGAKMDGGTT